MLELHCSPSVGLQRRFNTGMLASIPRKKYSDGIEAACLWRKSERIIKSNRYAERYDSMAHCIVSGLYRKKSSLMQNVYNLMLFSDFKRIELVIFWTPASVAKHSRVFFRTEGKVVSRNHGSCVCLSATINNSSSRFEEIRHGFDTKERGAFIFTVSTFILNYINHNFLLQ
jgi:hypothetical protein